MTGGDYTFPAHSITSGGEEEMTGGDYEMQDAKGQGVIGEMTGGDYEMGLGVVYGTLGEPLPPPIISGEDNGLIYNTRIRSLGTGANHIMWKFREGVTRAKIFYLKGDNTQFSSDPGYVGPSGEEWTFHANYGEGQTFATIVPSLIEGQNVYYRIVPHGVDIEDIFGYDHATGLPYNNRTVGQINITLAANDKQLVCLPMHAGMMSVVLDGQIASGQELYLYPQSGRGLTGVTYADDALGGDFELLPWTGFWIGNDSNPKTITFVGSFETLGSEDLPDKSLTGNTVPFSQLLSVLGGDEGDTIYPQSGRGLTSLTFDDGSWPADRTIDLAEGFWYQSAADRRWNINLMTGSRIETR